MGIYPALGTRTYIGRGRGRGYIGRPISYKIKLNFIFARKTLIFFIKTI